MVSIDFTTAWHEGDIQLVISEDEEDGDKTLFASKSILSVWSPVFAAMFKEDTFKEGTNKQVKMPNKKYDDVLELLKVLHPPNIQVTLANVYRLLPLAHEYQIQNVVDRCEETIITDQPTIDNITLADDFNLKKLHAHCMEHIATLTLAQIEGDESYSTVSDKSKAEMMSKRVKGLESNVKRLESNIKGLEIKVTGLEQTLESKEIVMVQKIESIKNYVCELMLNRNGINCQLTYRLENVRCRVSELCNEDPFVSCCHCWNVKSKTLLEHLSTQMF